MVAVERGPNAASGGSLRDLRAASASGRRRRADAWSLLGSALDDEMLHVRVEALAQLVHETVVGPVAITTGVREQDIGAGKVRRASSMASSGSRTHRCRPRHRPLPPPCARRFRPGPSSARSIAGSGSESQKRVRVLSSCATTNTSAWAAHSCPTAFWSASPETGSEARTRIFLPHPPPYPRSRRIPRSDDRL